MMGMGHYRGGGVGRIKGFVSQGVGGESGDRSVAPTGIGPGHGEPTLMGRLANVVPPPAHTSRASARAAPGPGEITLTLALSHRGRG